MTGFAATVKSTTAAVALTAAAVLAPAALAQADEDISAASARAVGNSAFLEVAYLDDGPSETPFNAPLQNKWIWIGESNPEPPTPYAILFHLDPMVVVSRLPEPVRELYGWFTNQLHFETCLLGASLKFGPYGTVTSALARTC